MGVPLPCAAVEHLQGDLFHWGFFFSIDAHLRGTPEKLSVSDVLSRVAARAVFFPPHVCPAPTRSCSPTKDYAKHWCEGTRRSARAACVALPVVCARAVKVFTCSSVKPESVTSLKKKMYECVYVYAYIHIVQINR